MIISTVWLGVIGFIDDYIKVYLKNKSGLAGKSKILGQVGLGIIVSLIMIFNSDIVIKEQLLEEQRIVESNQLTPSSIAVRVFDKARLLLLCA